MTSGAILPSPSGRRSPWLPMAPMPPALGSLQVQRYQALLWEGLDLRGRLLPGTVYALLDGAAVDAVVHLPTRLWESGVEHDSLYEGPVAPDMAAVAPYLVRLERNTPVTRWVLTEGWNRPWAVFVRSAATFVELRRHFRQFLLVREEAIDGRTPRRLYFRFYDPRVLPPYLASCTVAERRAFTGPVMEWVAQDYPVRNRPGHDVVRLKLDAQGGSMEERVEMVAPAPLWPPLLLPPLAAGA